MSGKAATYGFAAVVLAIVAMLVIPLPPALLDGLLALNIIGSGVVLLLSITIGDPLEFAAFAPALLVATLFRLALDVSATRLILTQGHLDGGVGSIIPAFGALVVGGNLVVGIIVFAILITIQFVVISSGSQRVAEVAARFTLDAMPGKQMAIDADLHAGAIDAEGARRKRLMIQKEADFYGAMDGAGKFVKGDAIAALIIVALNLAGGIAVGVVYHAMGPLEAIDTFALLSIGNALVTTLPAFLLSTSMGLMVTRVTADGSLGVDLASQIFARPDALRAAGGFALLLALVPALPRVPFVLLGFALLGCAQLVCNQVKRSSLEERQAREAARRAAIRRPEMALGLVGVDALSIDLGADLGALLTPPHADALLDRIGEVRRALASDIGPVSPGVRLRDDLAREGDTYAVRVRDAVAGEGRLRLDAVLAVGDEAILAGVGGNLVREPVYGLPARWIAPQHSEAAARRGVLVFDPISIIGSHLAEVARSHAADLLGRQELQTLLEHFRITVPTLVKEVGTDALPLAVVHKTFELLLRERVWPRDTVATLQAMIDAGAATRDPRQIAEAVRRAIVPANLRRRDIALLEPLIVGPEVEAELLASWSPDGDLAPRPEVVLALRSAVDDYVAQIRRDRAAVICTAALRPNLAELLRRFGATVEVFAYGEIPPEIELRPAVVVGSPEINAPAST
jgi:flagellar biosynthesis protein FlhA